MVIEAKIKGSLALNSHPMGCKKGVENQIEYITKSKQYSGPKKALILGSSSGYGLSSRLSLMFGGANADTIGVSFEKEGTVKKVGTAGWYNNIWVKEAGEKAGLVTKNFIGDAFGDEMREQVIQYIKSEFGGKIDILVYSLASGVRVDPKTGIKHVSTLKPIGEALEGPTFNIEKERLEMLQLEPATDEDIANTVKVMGGEDWELWVNALSEAGVLSEGFKTVAYSYIGAECTRRIYREGAIGKAKEHLELTAEKLDGKLKEIGGEAYTSVNRAIVTKASAYIPIFPLYAGVLFKVMEELGVQENCVEHTHRLFADMIYGESPEFDEKHRLRPDNWEMREDVQKITQERYTKVTFENFREFADFVSFKKDFMQLNGFEYDGVDYSQDVDLEALSKMIP